MEENSYENILIYDVLYKTLICAKSLHIMFDKVDGLIRDHDETKYLALFGPEKYDSIFDKNRDLIGLKSGITYVASRNSAKINIDSDDDLPLEKKLTLCNVVILIRSVLNKNNDQYYYKMFLIS